jgi:hypothetical protein
MTDAMTKTPAFDDEDVPELRMSAYYYGFSETGVKDIDLILSSVATAGKAYHHTDQWHDDVSYSYPNMEGKNPVEWIQNAANSAAYIWKTRSDQCIPASDIRPLVSFIEYCLGSSVKDIHDRAKNTLAQFQQLHPEVMT